MEGAEVAHLHLPGLTLKYYPRTEALTPHSRDIVPGVYEGGFKLWECTADLLRFLQAHPQLVAGKRVLEMGCGHGLAAVLAAKLGATCIGLQDFNSEVLTQLTRTTLEANECGERAGEWLGGDWATLKRSGEAYEVILGAELIYSENNYGKITAFLEEFLGEGGVCLMANKHYYFGVGGNMPAFKKHLAAAGFLHESVAQLVPPTGGNKKEIILISRAPK